jgi:hypothetical protein
MSIILDREQIKYLLTMCDEAITREIIGEDDPWGSQTKCGFGRSETKCY